MRTSYSAIETYLQCPQRYKFQEIDRIRVPKSREAIFGTLIHETLKFVFKRDPLFPTLDEVISYFREHWPSQDIFKEKTNDNSFTRAWSEEENRAYFQEGVKMLKNFYEKNAPWNFTVLDLESRFEVALTDEKTGEAHVLAGIIDRIDKLPDDRYEIIDYKTSKRMPSQRALNDNLQLSLYSLGVQTRWPHLTAEKITLSLYFLKHREKLSTVATEDSIKRTKEHILSTIREIQDRIRSGKEFEPMPGILCDWCGYKPLCPAWRHLYENKKISREERAPIEQLLTDYFDTQKTKKEQEKKLGELQEGIKEYMEKNNLTRVFGESGIVSKSIRKRYEYDFEKIKALLSPLGKWEDVLKADEIKLRKIMQEIPLETRTKIEEARTLSKEYTTLTATRKKGSGKEMFDTEEDETLEETK